MSDVRAGHTVAFEGIEARGVDVQVQIGPGVPAFTIVGLPDKAVAEKRVRGALNAIGLGLPPKRITVNLAPADLPKAFAEDRAAYLAAGLDDHLAKPFEKTDLAALFARWSVEKREADQDAGLGAA